MSHEISDNAKLIMQSTSVGVIRGHFHEISYLRQTYNVLHVSFRSFQEAFSLQKSVAQAEP